MFQSVIRILALLAGTLTFVTAAVRGSVSLDPADQSSSEPTTVRTTDNSLSLDPVLAKNTVLREDVPYGEHDMQRLDVYSPKGARRVPVVVFVHGGGWTKGDKSAVGSMPKLLNENDIAFVSINYRLTPTVVHPAQVRDVAAAVRWVYRHADELGCDREKVVLMGSEAGCHLAALTALDPRYLAEVKLRPADLRGVAAWGGRAYDLAETVKAGGSVADDIKQTFGDSEDVWRDASPVSYVKNAHAGTAFLFVSLEPGSTAHKAADHLAGLIRDANGEVESGLLKGQDPFSANHLLDDADDCSGKSLIDFIRKATKEPVHQAPIHDRR